MLKVGLAHADLWMDRALGAGQVRDDEDGLTLVEMMVAIMVLGVVMMAMASVLVTSAHSIRGSERVVHSTQIGSLLVEELLALAFEDVALYEKDAEDHYGGSTFEGRDLVLLPEPSDSKDPEEIEKAREDHVPRAHNTLNHEGVEFTVETAVVWEDDSGTEEAQDYKRLIIMLTWEHRGEVRTARTEAIRSPDPAEHPLRATVVPDVIRLVDRGVAYAGTNDASFKIHVTAVEPQSSVTLKYNDRGNEAQGPKQFTAVAGSEKTEWQYTFSTNGEEWANGGTLFEVTGTSLIGEVERTTMGRGVFLHDLEFNSDEIDIDVPEADEDGALPIFTTDDGESGACSSVDITATVEGAMRNDPLMLYFLDDLEGDRLGEIHEDEDEPRPMSFDSTGATVYGATYRLTLEPGELLYEEQAESMVLEFMIGRSADAADPIFLETEVELSWLEEGAPCPA